MKSITILAFALTFIVPHAYATQEKQHVVLTALSKIAKYSFYAFTGTMSGLVAKEAYTKYMKKGQEHIEMQPLLQDYNVDAGALQISVPLATQEEIEHRLGELETGHTHYELKQNIIKGQLEEVKQDQKIMSNAIKKIQGDLAHLIKMQQEKATDRKEVGNSLLSASMQGMVMPSQNIPAENSYFGMTSITSIISQDSNESN